jgi:hypothetical protein
MVSGRTGYRESGKQLVWCMHLSRSCGDRAERLLWRINITNLINPEQMKRQLPLVDIRGTDFFLDVLNDELWQKGNRDNKIPFTVFELNGDGYTFLYDEETKTTPGRAEDITEFKPGYIWVTLGALMELDPEGIALKYGIPLSVLSPGLAVHEEDDEEDYYEEDRFY